MLLWRGFKAFQRALQLESGLALGGQKSNITLYLLQNMVVRGGGPKPSATYRGQLPFKTSCLLLITQCCPRWRRCMAGWLACWLGWLVGWVVGLAGLAGLVGLSGWRVDKVRTFWFRLLLLLLLP